MGKADSAAKECLSDNVRFADFVDAMEAAGYKILVEA